MKIILAYSGGLDTSVILKWLIDKGNEVICYIADVGQEEDFEKARQKALKIGATKVYIEDLKKEFVEEYLHKALKSNAEYEGKYLLGTSLARPLIAKKQIETAKKEGTKILAHGATGKGNDQVRFELTYYSEMPDVQIISPWKDPEFLDLFKGRTDLINYAKIKGIPIESTLEKPYSVDENIMHTSFEGGNIENPANEITIYKRTKNPKEAPEQETKITIHFKKGVPLLVEDNSNNKLISGSVEIYEYLNKIGGQNAIGRIDIVENRFVGMKSRGIYETPAGTILLKAHRDIESITLDREVSHLKDTLMPKIAQLIYNGFWNSPEFDFLMTAIEKSQENVEGRVHITLYKGNIIITARDSAKTLYDTETASMDKIGNYDQTDAKGFIKLQALRLMK